MQVYSVSYDFKVRLNHSPFNFFFTVSDGGAVSVPLGDGERTVDVEPRSLFGKKNKCKCKKKKCKKSECFNWCKQNCACCKKKNGVPENLNGLKDATKCKKWRKKSNANKCERKFGKLAIV